MNKRQRIERARVAGRASAGVPRGESARENGRRGGRPGNPEIWRIMAERNCSRQAAWKIFKKKKGKGVHA